MEIPNLPTDNLYKFIALSGIVLLLFFNIYPSYVINGINEELNIIETESGELEFEIKLVEESLIDLENEIEEAKGELVNYEMEDTTELKINIKDLKLRLRDSDYREYLEFLYNYRENIFPVVKLHKQIEEKNEKLKLANQENQLKRYKIKRKLEIIGEKNNEVKKTRWLWFIGSLIGSLMAVFGFKLWYTKVQKPLDQKLLNEITEPNSKS